MAKLSLNRAEKIARKTKKTIKKDLDEGRLSGSKNSRGHWEIEESELARFYGLNTDDLVSTPTQTPQDTAPDQTENRIKIAELEAEVKALSAQIDRTDLDRDRERQQLSKHIEDLRTSMAVLTDQRAGQGQRRFFGLLPAKSA